MQSSNTTNSSQFRFLGKTGSIDNSKENIHANYSKTKMNVVTPMLVSKKAIELNQPEYPSKVRFEFSYIYFRSIFRKEISLQSSRILIWLPGKQIDA